MVELLKYPGAGGVHCIGEVLQFRNETIIMKEQRSRSLFRGGIDVSGRDNE